MAAPPRIPKRFDNPAQQERYRSRGYTPNRGRRAPITPRSEVATGLYDDRPVKPLDGAALSRMPVRQQQRYLRRMGYNVMVDGQKGPNTASALDAFLRGKSTSQYNQWWKRRMAIQDDADDEQADITPTGQRDVPTRPTPKGTAPRAVKPPPVRSSKGRVVLPQGRASNNPFLRDGIVDPEIYANAVADAEYGPILAELLRQEERTRNIGTNRTAEIRDMYGTFVKNSTDRFAQANKERDRLSMASEGLTAAMAGAVPLGEAGTAELMARGNLDSEYQRMVGATDDSYDARLLQAAEQGGVFAATQSQREMDADLAEIAGRRTEATTAKGQSAAKARQDIIRWNAEQSLNRQQLQAQIQDSRMKNQLAAMELAAAMETLPLEAEEKQAAIDRIYADIRRTNMLLPYEIQGMTARTGASNRSGRPKQEPRMPRNFAALRPNDRGELRTGIMSRLSEAGPKDYTHAVPIINNFLRSLGYKPMKNKQVKTFAKNIAAEWGASMGVGPPLAKWWNQ